MEAGYKPEDFLDRLILEALEQKPDEQLPAEFTGRLVSRYERKTAFRELLVEFGMKTALVAGSLLVLAGFLFLPMKESLHAYLLLAAGYWQIITGIVLVILFTFFIDQVLLRFLNTFAYGRRN